MCGIVGIVDLKGEREIDQALLASMRDALLHRGPDESGSWFSPGVGLGHRRLAIIDLESGQQPLSNESGSVTISFNGEIYNYREITAQLKQKGYRFRTNSDTETIVHAWEEWGENCVDHLRGMFAFAIWDQTQKKLFLARDRLGIKPLVYTVTSDGFLLFASEIKSLLVHPLVRRKIELPSIENYFALGYVPEPDTIYRDIKKLEAGHTLLLHNRRLGQPVRYWDVPFEPTYQGSYEDACHELVDRLKEAIDIRMVAEVPLGAFLSGGVDSSAVVALMAELQPDPVHTCSIGMAIADYDESSYAESVANRFKTDHHHRVVGEDDFKLIDKLASIYDEPYADSSALPTLRVCELARKRVTVALSGDGSDEFMSGYRRHRWHMNEEQLRQKIPLQARKAVFGPIGRVYPKADWAPQVLRAKSTLQSLALDSVSAYFNSVSMNSNTQRSRMYSQGFRDKLGAASGLDVFRRHAANAPSQDPMALIQYLDSKTYLVDDILTKVDKASMAHSLEVRVPFLDHEFVSWVSGLPGHFKIKAGEGKAVLKKSLESRLSNDVLYRKKMGFSVPLSEWIRGPLNERVSHALTGERLNDTGIVDTKELKKLLVEHQSKVRDHSTQIWTLLMFDAFLKNSDCELD